MSKIIEFLNNNLESNNELICHYLTRYLHTSYTYSKQNIDGSRLIIQPGWPEETVIGYRYYYDSSFDSKKSRLILILESKSETEISLKTFKKYLRNNYESV